MTDEQDGQPRRQPIDGPTVMGPSTGHLRGPAPAEPTSPDNPPDERARTEPTPAEPDTSGVATTPAPHSATWPGTADEPSQPDAASPATSSSNPPDEPARAEPTPAKPQPDRPDANPPDEPTLTTPTQPSAPHSATWPGTPHPGAAQRATWSSNPPDEPTLVEPQPNTQDAAPPDEPTLAEPTLVPPTQPSAAPPATGPGNPPDEPTSATQSDVPDAASPSATWPGAPDEPTLAEPPLANPAPPQPRPNTPPDEPTVANPTPLPAQPDNPALATPTWPDGPTMATPVDEVTVPQSAPDDPTTAVRDESPTTTGPTVAGWPLDELLPPPPTELIWQPDTPEPPPAPRRPVYYIALGAAVVLVVALVAVAALVTVTRPTREVAGTARPTQGIPDITGSAPPPTTTVTAAPQDGPADHPLSTSTARMGDATCALPRFDLADDRQAAFYAAAKTCADDAWRGVLDEAGLRGEVEVVTVTSTVRTRSCGEITPASPATQCDGTVYMTPAHLRDAEQNGRYPGRYFGVFLREYARALQFTTGLSELAATTEDAETRLAQQATCMAGIASGAMANRGAVDANITGEISARLSAVDAPPDAKALLDKGFEERNLKACNTW